MLLMSFLVSGPAFSQKPLWVIYHRSPWRWSTNRRNSVTGKYEYMSVFTKKEPITTPIVPNAHTLRENHFQYETPHWLNTCINRATMHSPSLFTMQYFIMGEDGSSMGSWAFRDVQCLYLNLRRLDTRWFVAKICLNNINFCWVIQQINGL